MENERVINSIAYEDEMGRECLKFRHAIKVLQQLTTTMAVAVCMLASLASQAQVLRAPANFVPDDDRIVVPMVIEKNFVEEFHDKHERKFRSAKQKIRHWIAQEEYAEAYGHIDSGVIDLPTAEEKQKFFERNYLRFITKDFEKSANKLGQRTAQDLYNSWNADDELAAIEAQEEKEKFLLKAKRQNGQKSNDIKKVVKVGKEKIRLDFQPRLEIGMVKIRFRSPYFEARAWVGINGNQEIQIEKDFKSTDTEIEANYFIEQKRLLAKLDQRLTRHMSLRLTHDKTESGGTRILEGKDFENNVIQLRFGMGF